MSLNIAEEKEAKNSEEKVKYLQFDLGNETYAIPLLSVKEVIPVPETTKIPNSPNYFKGVMNLRGQVISIVDLRTKLSVKKNEEAEEAVIIVNYENINIGLIVDSINRVLNILSTDIKNVPEIRSQVNSKFIEGFYEYNSHLTVLMDMKSVLNINELIKLNNLAA